jgi:O-Antigen ligase
MLKKHHIPLLSENFDSAIFLKIQQTKWLFWALCFYLISQCFTIPILPIGPSWALWPCISDFATIFFVLAFLFCLHSTSSASKQNKKLLLFFLLVIFGCILSYIYYLDAEGYKNNNGVRFGIFQIFRLIQFTSIFWITAKIPLTLERITILNRIVDFVLIFVCSGILLTYSGVLPLSTVINHLPKDGPWIFYEAYGYSGSGKGLGFVGYNHAYTAVQVIMLVTLRTHLTINKNKVLSDSFFLVLSIICCFLSESRAGFAGMLFFAIRYWTHNPKHIFILLNTAAVVSIVGSFIGLQTLGLGSSVDSVFERQKTLFAANDSDNLSGRDEIWMQRIDYLNQEPMRWLVGVGFGAATDSGDNAHMLILHIILETGFLGLFIFSFLFTKILQYLHLQELGTKPIFWATISLLISSSSQETFYPVAALGHFLGFYLCSIAISLRKKINIPKNLNNQEYTKKIKPKMLDCKECSDVYQM